MNKQKTAGIVTLTLNPALDQTLYLPQFKVGEVNRVSKERFDPAGKGINVAKVINSLGQEVTVTGLLGRKNAIVFEDYFQNHQISNSLINVAGANRVNLKIVNESNDEVTEINFPGIRCAASDLLKLKRVLQELAAESRIFVLSGSLPEGVPADIYRELIKILKDYHCKVFLDTSGEALVEGIKAQPDVLKPNVEELSQLMGRSMDQERDVLNAMDELLASGISEVVVSLGEKGALAADRKQRLLVHSPEVRVRSTVGAGDALVAGLVFAEAKGLLLEERARWAIAIAAASVAQPGTQAGTFKDVEQLLPNVVIEKLRR